MRSSKQLSPGVKTTITTTGFRITKIAKAFSWGSKPPGFHQSSTRVPPGFYEILRGLRGGASTQKSTAGCWGYHLSLFFFFFWGGG